MLHLLAASLIWALSFGLIKHRLAGLDAGFVAAVRLMLSFGVLLPFLRPRGLGFRMVLRLMGLGAVQYGLMYVFYIHSYRYLAAHQVALFTIFTPLYVVLLHSLQKKRLHRVFLLTACLAVAGTAFLMTAGSVESGAWVGVGLLQVSNICFAFGQLRYRDLRTRLAGRSDREIFALLYGGAFLVAAAATVLQWPQSGLAPTAEQRLVLLYLGVLPSGIGFFLWNVGASRTNAGTLGVFNNAKIPLAVACSLLLFGESAAIGRLLVGGGTLFAAVFLSELAFRGRIGREAEACD